MTSKQMYPKQYDLDGVYFRVKRGNKWCNRCFSDLTGEEQNEFLKKYDSKALGRLLTILDDAMADLVFQYAEECPDKERWFADYLRNLIKMRATGLRYVAADLGVREVGLDED